MGSHLKAGAAKSLNKTVSEIMEFMDDDDKCRAKELRNFLRKKIGDLSERWFKKGFNRGHIQSFEAFGDDGNVRRSFDMNSTVICSRAMARKFITRVQE
jgi:hypothetical protein